MNRDTRELGLQDNPERFAVCNVRGLEPWLVDTCAGGTFSYDVDDALEFDDEDEAQEALERVVEYAIAGDFYTLRIR